MGEAEGCCGDESWIQSHLAGVVVVTVVVTEGVCAEGVFVVVTEGVCAEGVFVVVFVGVFVGGKGVGEGVFVGVFVVVTEGVFVGGKGVGEESLFI